MPPERIIVGQGLAGTCLAWHLWWRELPFAIVDIESGGSSRVAAGLINPVTGKNYEASKGLTEFLPAAIDFYSRVESILSCRFWHPLPILRLADDAKEWEKMQAKSLLPDVARWLGRNGRPFAIDGWHGAIELQGGGRLDTRGFLDASREFFTQHGLYHQGELPHDKAPPHTIWCEGAKGLLQGRYGPHRCAKGEILTIQAPDWDENTIRIGGGGWLVPIGNGHFKVGATYEWDQLDETPTEEGLDRLRAIATRLGNDDFEIHDHEAGIRPILRRSEPLIGPLGNDQWMFNALGSKGSLYAPGIANQLSNWIVDGTTCDPYYDYGRWDKAEKLKR